MNRVYNKHIWRFRLLRWEAWLFRDAKVYRISTKILAVLKEAKAESAR